MVLVPEVIKAIKPIRDVPVLAAGGIMNGRQMAACMAMGAAGVWTGSVWLATVESETTEIFREKMIAASSRDAIRSTRAVRLGLRQIKGFSADDAKKLIPPLYGALLKNEQDVHLFEQLLFLHRRNAR